MLLNTLKLCFIGLLISFMSCDVVIDESRCGQAATDFANIFNRQDYRSAIRLFRSGELDGGQYKRLENNFKYTYRVAGAIRAMDLIKQEGKKLIYKSTHENTSMEITFRVDENCRLISYLIQTHFPDSLPILDRNKTQMALPFHGEWRVDWGGTAVEQNYHNRYRNMKGAIDFSKVDAQGRTFSRQGKENEDYYSFGQPILAPCTGTVVKVVSGVKDNRIGRTNASRTYGNTVVMRTNNQEYLLFAHLRQQSILVKEGQRLNRGDTVAQCGNSGYSKQPHLHFIVQNVADLFHPTGARSYFDDILVDGAVKQDYSPVKGERVSNL
jgi:murein DD-endopeptidase MepM/ murein hydrolase activator NlpD